MSSQAAYDLVVVGAGVFGLWTAKRAVEAGMRVALIERDRAGGGASATPLGALTAHSPDRWNPKKQFQLDALIELETEVARLEAETGLDVGYRRAGRVLPIRSEAFKAQIAERSAGAARRWRGHVYEAVESPLDPGWMNPAAAPLGHVRDTLAARISADRYCAALRAWLAPRADLIEGVGFARWENGALLDDGRRLVSAALALTAGVEAFGMMAALTGETVGRDAPGRTALVRLPAVEGLEDRPLLYDGGLYVAPKGGDLVALGGLDAFEGAPSTVRAGEGEVFARLIDLCPALDGAPIAQWWAGVRPKCLKRDPLIGRLPVSAPIWTAAGGFKIGLGIAHRSAAALVAEIGGSAGPDLPATFRPEHHFQSAPADVRDAAPTV